VTFCWHPKQSGISYDPGPLDEVRYPLKQITRFGYGSQWARFPVRQAAPNAVRDGSQEMTHPDCLSDLGLAADERARCPRRR
jgi:hypothetical protein